MGNTCYSAPRTELDQHIDKFHKTLRRAPQQQPFISHTHFTEHDDMQIDSARDNSNNNNADVRANAY